MRNTSRPRRQRGSTTRLSPSPRVLAPPAVHSAGARAVIRSALSHNESRPDNRRCCRLCGRHGSGGLDDAARPRKRFLVAHTAHRELQKLHDTGLAREVEDLGRSLRGRVGIDPARCTTQKASQRSVTCKVQGRMRRRTAFSSLHHAASSLGAQRCPPCTRAPPLQQPRLLQSPSQRSPYQFARHP